MQPMNPAGPPPKSRIPGYHTTQQQKFTPGGLSIYEQLLGPAMQAGGQGADFLKRLASGDESLFEELEAPAYRSYEKMLGQTASRFSQVGGRDSSAFRNAIAGQGAELAENIQAKRLGIRQGAVSDLLNLQQMLMGTNPYETYGTPKSQGGEKQDIMRLVAKYGPKLAMLIMSGGNPAAAAATPGLDKMFSQQNAVMTAPGLF